MWQDKKNLAIALIIRDCSKDTIERFNQGIDNKWIKDNIFVCPDDKTNNFWKSFIEKMKDWLKTQTKYNSNNSDNSNNSHNSNKTIEWWKKIEKFGLFLPSNVVKLYINDMKFYTKKRINLEYFYQQLNNEFEKLENDNNGKKDLAQRKLELFPFGNLFEKYNKLIQNSGNSLDALNIIKSVATTPKLCKLLEIFIIYCLPHETHYENPGLPHENPNLTSWLLSEYLYVLDDICNNRNTIVLRDIRKKIKELQSRESQSVDKIAKKELKKQLDEQYDKLKNIEITASDFLHNVQSLVNFIAQWKIHLPQRNLKNEPKIADSMKKLKDCVKQFSHRLFIQG